jgi:hypothetical protein
MMEKTAMKKVAKAEVKAHEKKMHGAKGMKAGGPTSMDMKRMGRNLARVANQRGSSRGR